MVWLYVRSFLQIIIQRSFLYKLCIHFDSTLMVRLVPPWPVRTTSRWASLAGCAGKNCLQAGRHGVSSAWSSIWPSHSSLWHHFPTRLRSANQQQLLVSNGRLDTYGRWAFAIAGLTLELVTWRTQRSSDERVVLTSFKQFRKTILFSFY